MKGFNDYAERGEFSIFKSIFFGAWTMQGDEEKNEYFAEQGFATAHAAYVEKGMFHYVCTDEKRR